jgi:hypothetical protein
MAMAASACDSAFHDILPRTFDSGHGRSNGVELNTACCSALCDLDRVKLTEVPHRLHHLHQRRKANPCVSEIAALPTWIMCVSTRPLPPHPVCSTEYRCSATVTLHRSKVGLPHGSPSSAIADQIGDKRIRLLSRRLRHPSSHLTLSTSHQETEVSPRDYLTARTRAQLTPERQGTRSGIMYGRQHISIIS